MPPIRFCRWPGGLGQSFTCLVLCFRAFTNAQLVFVFAYIWRLWRSESALTLPMPVYVDDLSLIGKVVSALVNEWQSFKAFLLRLGISMKEAELQKGLPLWFSLF